MAAIASAAMIAQQVAGKATRDSRMMLRHTPAKVVPVGFAASALALLL